MRKLLKLAGVAAVALAIGPALSALPAGATPPTGYGFDNTQHVLVGGGSDTTFRAMTSIGELYSISQLSGCPQVTAVGPTLGNCVANASPETNNLGNYQHDTIAQAGPVGSSAGIASLNGFSSVQYAGTVNPVPSGTCLTATSSPNVDFGRSSRGPKTSGGNAACGNELTADTFWGYAQDGVEVTVFNNRGSFVQGVGGSALTPSELYHIWNCDFTQWSQVPSLGISPGAPNDGPIVPWQMNTSSGTFATFQTYLINNGGAPAGWSPDGQACDRKLASGNVPLENDIKPLINDPASLSTSASSVDNPENWIWWGSFGVFSAFPYTSAVSRGGTPYQAIAAPVNGVLPSTSGVIANTYPIGRTLFHVTRKQDADCPHTGSSCDFPGHPGPTLPAGGTDLNVTGGSSGVSGAVRELTRFLCRGSAAQEGLDPYTGTNFSSEITTAINGAGFTVVPVALRTSGSRCSVQSS